LKNARKKRSKIKPGTQGSPERKQRLFKKAPWKIAQVRDAEGPERKQRLFKKTPWKIAQVRETGFIPISGPPIFAPPPARAKSPY
jgi:hypothetical protein